MFDTTSADTNLTRIEEEVRRFWQWYDLPAAVRAARQAGPPYRILQQPLPVAGQVWADQTAVLAAADLMARYHTLCGEAVERQTLWACHGLPVEVAVEQSLPPAPGGYDLERFNAACRQACVAGVRQGEAWAERLGAWIDPASTHTSITSQSVGAVWKVLRRLWDAGRLKQQRAVVPVCPRCATPLSEAEAGLNLIPVQSKAVWVCLPWEGEPDTYLPIWTDAPWRLVGMVALAAHPTADYALVEWAEQPNQLPTRLLVAEAALDRSIQGTFRSVRRLSAKALRGIRYHPLFTFLPAEEGAGRLVLSSEVPLDQGTGLMPVTPAFDALSLSIAEALDVRWPEMLDSWGALNDSVTPWRGLSPLAAEPLLVQDLHARGLLLRQQPQERLVAHCPHCQTALLPLARSVWQALMDGRSWIIGRERPWGVPLPVWVCEQCAAQVCVAGLDDLAHRTGLDPDRIDVHRPAVDRLSFPCQACGRPMRRVPAVVDADLELAILPWAMAPRFVPAALAVGMEGRTDWLAAVNETASLVEGAPAWERSVALPAEAGDAAWDPGRSALSDALRWCAYTGVPPDEAEQSFLRPLWRLAVRLSDPAVSSPNPWDELLDRWIHARLHQAIRATTDALDACDIRRAARELAALVEAGLKWYLPHRSGGAADAPDLISHLAAPFVPHLAEAIHRQQETHAAESVHLGRWPQPDPNWEDAAVLAHMALMQRLAALGQAARTHTGLDPGRTLPSATISLLGDDAAFLMQPPAHQALLARLMGVARVQLVPGLPDAVRWRVSLRPERSVSRAVQAHRVNAALDQLDEPAATLLAQQVWHGFSVSVSLAAEAVTLLPEELEVEVEARPGWAAAVEAGRIVALELA